ncbi:hypothetical protein BCR42DRAFT_418533 [Absidia repens]|uniref:PH domain-containing protein n=1 Tax=Absidia repens TaxID=90262 RepID=A0A1X2IBR8_9FUNG|nr:hypothetical protein BCR42DRAFT_418533 [Absidia repens]
MTTVTPTQTMTTRIFIEDAKTHKTVQLTNVLTTAMVIQYLKRKDLLDNSGDWTLFEIANSHGVERPLRLWEIVMDITGCWEQNTNNALLVKKYGFYETLTMDSIRDRPSPIHGWLHIEYKKGKWQKRYCFIKDHAIHHAKDSKCANSAILCHLAAFDVYTLLQPSTTCPTPFVFALRAQDRAAIFEKEHDYMRLFTAENQSSMETWVLGIRQAKSIIQYQQHPKRVQNPLAALTSATTTSTSGGGDPSLRRYKSTKREPVSSEDTNNNTVEGRSRSMSRSESSSRRITDETIKRKASTRGLSRNGTTRNREHHHQPHQHDTNDTNGTTATTTTANEEGTTSSTLIHIEDKLQFSKGSLLDKGNMAPPMTPASSATATHSATITTTSTSSAPPSITNSNTSSQHHHHHHHHHQPMQNNSSSGSNSNRNMMSRSKSTRETSSSSHHTQHRSRADDGILSHHTSIRRKDRGQQHRQQQQQHDVPLPNTHAIMTSSSGNPMSTTSRNNTDNTLLKLNNTPERFHTQTLLQRQMKPLLNFDQDQSSDHRRG